MLSASSFSSLPFLFYSRWSPLKICPHFLTLFTSATMAKRHYRRIPMDLVRSFRRLRIGNIIPGLLKAKWRRGQTLMIERVNRSRQGSFSQKTKKEARPRGTKRKEQSSPPPPVSAVPPQLSSTRPQSSKREKEEEVVSPRKLIRARRRRHHSDGEESGLANDDYSAIFTPMHFRRRSTPIQSFTVQEMAAEEDGQSKERTVCNRKTYIQMIKARGCLVRRSPPPPPQSNA